MPGLSLDKSMDDLNKNGAESDNENQADQEEEEEEEWYCQAVRRYNHLCEYDLPFQSASVLALSPSGNRLAVAGVSSEELNLCLLRIPQKVLTTDPVREGFLNGRDFGVVAAVKKAISSNDDEDDQEVKELSFLDESTLALITPTTLTIYRNSPDSDLLKLVTSEPLPDQRAAYNLPKVVGNKHLILQWGANVVLYGMSEQGLKEVKRVPVPMGSVLLDVGVKGGEGTEPKLVIISQSEHGSHQVTRTKEGCTPDQTLLLPSGCKTLSSPRLSPDCEQLVAISDEGEKVLRLDFKDGTVLESEEKANLCFRWTHPSLFLCLTQFQPRPVVTALDPATFRPLFRHDGHRSARRVLAAVAHAQRDKMALSLDDKGKLNIWVYNE